MKIVPGPKSAKAGAPVDAPIQTEAPKPVTETPLAPRMARLARPPPLAGVPSIFPLDDLGDIGGVGRWSSGFVLDGGSLRLMWLSARRVEKDNQPGFEISFFAHGKMRAILTERMKQKGAGTGTHPFTEASVVAGPDGRDRLKFSTNTWTPSATQAVTLEEPGRFRVDFVADKPEALKGAVRIRLTGTDDECTDTLKDVIDKLGLQSLFAPTTPAAVERYKLIRLLWAIDPKLVGELSRKTLDQVDDIDLGKALETAGAVETDEGRAAVEHARPYAKDLKPRIGLAQLLMERSPTEFGSWISAAGLKHGMLTTDKPEEADKKLLAALEKVGASPADIAAAKKRKPDIEFDRKLLRLALLVQKNASAATTLLEMDPSDAKLDRVRALGKKHGIDHTSERFEKVHFEEVYPGYLAVVDPGRVEELYKVGARYLYSTSDSPERVIEQLQGGQKSSFTRFHEGLLVQGKSSDADFNTGGAFSVFTRCVPTSQIRAAKNGGSNNFYNWGGSRPFKLVLNRRILGRLDWYGYNGDNYGRSTNLGQSNHGKEVIKAINTSFSSSNELMFGCGNSSKYVDFVICETDAQRTALLALFAKNGLPKFNGRDINEFVRVSNKFIVHPDDINPREAALEALVGIPEEEPRKAADAILQAAPAADSKVLEAAKVSVRSQLPTAVKTIVERSGRSPARTAIDARLPTLDRAGLEAEETALRLQLEAAAKEGAVKPFEVQENNLSYKARYATQKHKDAVEAAALAKIQELVDAQNPEKPTDYSSWQRIQTLAKTIADAVEAQAVAEIAPKIPELIASEAKEAIATAALEEYKRSIANSVRAAVENVPKIEYGAEWIATTIAAFTPEVRDLVITDLKTAVTTGLKNEVTSSARSALQATVAAVLDSAKPAARIAARDAYLALTTAPVEVKGKELAQALGRADDEAAVIEEVKAEIHPWLDDIVTTLLDARANALNTGAGSDGAITEAVTAVDGEALALVSDLLESVIKVQGEAALKNDLTTRRNATAKLVTEAATEAHIAEHPVDIGVTSDKVVLSLSETFAKEWGRSLAQRLARARAELLLK